jgi:hypothetical protein
MQFKIPQDVQMEDKIVGPLTLKQLIIVGVGGGLDYFIYISLSKMYVLEVSLIFVIPIGLITAAIAFLKIKGIPFLHFLFLSLEFYIKPRHRVWTPGAGEVFTSITSPRPKTKAELEQQKQTKKAPKELKNLDELTSILDSHSDIVEAKHEAIQNLIQH